jgi:hypothetical protein
VDGNYIGTDPAGTSPLGNAPFGIMVLGPNTSGNLIVSTNGQINLIRFNLGSGIELGGHDNVVLANTILANANHGISVTGEVNTVLGNSVNGNAVDGISVSGTGNSLLGNGIWNNGRNGVTVLAPAQANRISQNSITDHPGLGIDLGNDSVTSNDAGDGDTGPNALQNFPNLSNIVRDDSSVAVEGTLNSAPVSSYVLEFFWNDVCNSHNHGEGRSWIGQLTVTTDSSGNASFSAHFPVGVPAGLPVTATATSASGNTSEFSACRSATGPPTLAITRSADVLTFIWPTAAGDFLLQSSPMSLPPVWTDVSAPVTVFGGLNIVTQPATTSAYYRLRHR